MAMSTTSPRVLNSSAHESPRGPARSRMNWALYFVVLALTCGCRENSKTPEAALKQFISDIQNRRAQPAWNALSTASRADFERRSRAVDKNSPTPSATALAPKAADSSATSGINAARILFSEFELHAMSTPESISVASRLGSEVSLRVSPKSGPSANIRMIREGTSWKVDLLASLEAFPNYQPTRTATRTATSSWRP